MPGILFSGEAEHLRTLHEPCLLKLIELNSILPGTGPANLAAG